MEFSNSLVSFFIPSWSLILAGFLMAFLITWRAIPTIVNVSQLTGLNGKSNHRSSHKTSTPLFGGVAVFAGFILATVVIAGLGFVTELKYIIAGFIILFFIGLKDDIFIIDPKKKLVAQVLASLIVIILGDIRIENFHGFGGIYYISYIASVLFTLFVFIVITNGFNLIDGIDGLSSGVGIITSVTFGLWFWIAGHIPYVIFCFSLAGSLIAFFRFNVFSIKNKIFLGDTGALIIGLAMSIIVTRFLQFEMSASGQGIVNSTPTVAMGILIIPLFDTLRVFIIRVANGHSPFVGDRIHVHHRLLDLLDSHAKATFIMLITNILFIVIVVTLRNIGDGGLLTIVLALATGLSYIPVYLLKTKKERINKGNQEIEKTPTPTVREKGRLVRLLHL
jgi:UDP-N-acetylmuramyl pentapeptide phosphotransferase/UDP-N-acetylglucosamine-1-phosphate transferase